MREIKVSRYRTQYPCVESIRDSWKNYYYQLPIFSLTVSNSNFTPTKFFPKPALPAWIGSGGSIFPLTAFCGRRRSGGC